MDASMDWCMLYELQNGHSYNCIYLHLRFLSSIVLQHLDRCITQERIDLLDELGFSWEVRPSLERPRASWEQRLEELTEYSKAHGTFLVDPSTMPQLHAWCQEQRQRLRVLEKNIGRDVSKRMGPERVAALERIGFTRLALLNDSKPTSAVLTPTGPSFSTSDGDWDKRETK
jgi:hypothetical protein